MMTEDPISPENPNRKQIENGNSIFSPRFRSVAAMAGWDEEALLNASLVVEDTPDRDAKQKRRFDLQFKTPPTNNSRRKRRAQRKSPASIPANVLNLDEDEISREESLQNKEEPKAIENGEVKSLVSIPIVVLNLEDDETSREVERLQNKEEPKVIENGELNKPEAALDSCSSSAIPCMEKLREELSCAICLEICYEPSTTSCGHSFCKKCLRSAADKCGKRCPKCRQLISNGRSCTVNTVLWNTIQLLFPQEVESRKASSSSSKPSQSPPIKVSRNRTIQALNSPEGEGLNLERRRSNHQYLRNRTRGDNPLTRRRTRDPPGQDEDAALAMRLQREEFMGAFRDPNEQQQQQQRQNSFVLASESLRGAEERRTQEQHHRRSSVTLARTNLRAMASRAVNIRLRGRQP